ncbi:unnamed protein product [Rotaria sordida]|uniref:Uncharacterized protein n=1 Tax=Rotaria sordida TaxID=392033 RepID=A0A815DER2_9BILA|nr:unnamed protein product [Rotaria sordida]
MIEYDKCKNLQSIRYNCIMFQFYTILLLILYFTCSISIDTNKFSPKFIHKSNSNHHVVAIITETDQFNTNKNNTNNNNSFSNPPEDQVLNEHLKIIITIGCISVGIMVIVVVAYLIKTYFSYKTINIPNVNEHTVPLKT